MNTPSISDVAERVLARDPGRSVIVQAPAGSGKTELLMQRCLALLAQADEPEEVLAVTFTRKAAAEMRNRILRALQPAEGDERLPETAALAAAVLQRNKERGWHVLEYPGRLRIRTLDAVNSWLIDSAPVSGESAAVGVVSERSDELYDLAARRTLELITEDSEYGECVSTILSHLDNRAEQFVSLMSQMLKKRDQWLPLIGRGDFAANAREVLESCLQELVARELRTIDGLMPAAARMDLHVVLSYAALNLLPVKPQDPVCIWHDVAEFPPAVPDYLSYWQGIASFALVQDASKGGVFRKSITKANGFPTKKDGGDDALKMQARELLEELAGIESMADALDVVRSLPLPRYTEDQWRALEALISVLPVVAAQLIVVFRERGETDYIQIATEAQDSLRNESGPSDLALRLDYQIRHILIDEFQDTSRSQFKLLESLTEGWVPGDGRTLFVVGDPMQSIYRFRQAEVALFLQLWEQGIGQVKLEQVRLSSNFRSAPLIVNWVNDTFVRLMPDRNDPATGAVRFAPGEAVREEDPLSAVEMHVYEDPARVDEASDIADLVERCLDESPSDTVGILLRTRNQARLIVPELRRRGVPFSGQGLERPGEASVEQDLIALTRALSHQGDRTAWLALLRAPWCGLSLVDLELLCGADWHQTVLEQIAAAEGVEQLSADGQLRLQEFRERVLAIIERRGSLSLRDWVEGAWQQFGGPASLTDKRELAIAAQFFVTLDQYEEGGDIAEAFLLHERLAERQDQLADSNTRVHLLTLFKAKGLEYDTVILPALDGVTRRDDKPVMAWHQVAGEAGEVSYLMAPIEPAGQEPDPVHRLIGQFAAEQSRYELDRLLYVATTRAKKRLHLYFALKRNKAGEVSSPFNGTLLNRLWPVIAAEYESFAGPAGTEETREDWVQPRIRRFPAGWKGVPAPASVLVSAGGEKAREDMEVTFDWAGSVAMRVGSVVHRCLQHIAEHGIPAWQESDKRSIVQTMLLEEGIAEADVEAAETRVSQAIATALRDEQGCWVLAGDHTEAVCEYPVTLVADGQAAHFVIDRSFIDATGDRWIVDYKTSSHEGGNVAGFIDAEVLRYCEQLQRYRAAMQLLEPGRTIRTALYFPLLGVFRELE